MIFPFGNDVVSINTRRENHTSVWPLTQKLKVFALFPDLFAELAYFPTLALL